MRVRVFMYMYKCAYVCLCEWRGTAWHRSCCCWCEFCVGISLCVLVARLSLPAYASLSASRAFAASMTRVEVVGSQ